MIDRNDALPVSRQAKVLGISRGSVYYLPRPVSADDLTLMRQSDELHLDYPFAGSRMLQTFLVREGYNVGRLHVATLMKRMGIEAIYRQPTTSKPAPGHTVFPYLLRKLPVTRPNQIWGDGYHGYPHGAGLRLSCGCRRLVQPEGSGMEVIDYAGNGVLSGGGRGGSWAGDLQHRRASLPASPSPACCSRTRSRSAWMGKAPGETTSSSSACGGPSNTRRCTYGPTPVSRRHGPPSADISTAFTMPEGPIRALIGGRRMRPTSLRCSPSRLQHNHGRNPLSRSQPAVQPNRARSIKRSETVHAAIETNRPAISGPGI